MINLLLRRMARDAKIFDAREPALVRRGQVRLHIIEIQIETDVAIKLPVIFITRISFVLAPDLLGGIQIAPERRHAAGRQDRREHAVARFGIGVQQPVRIRDEPADVRFLQHAFHPIHVHDDASYVAREPQSITVGGCVNDLANVIDFDAIRSSGLKLAVDPLGGAGVAYWPRIAEKYGLPLEILNPHVDPTFRFMTLDWDGRIRMDCSSPYAMASMIANKDKYDVAWACDTDHDRHGVVTRSSGLLNPNHYLAVMIQYLFTHRPEWAERTAIGKTLVSSSMIDRVAKGLNRPMLEVPVGFKWFVDGLIDGSLGFVGEESAGATFLRRNGSVWTTDKDGLIPGLLAAEMTATTGKDPGLLYRDLTGKYGDPVYQRIDAAATKEQKAKLGKLSPSQVTAKDLAGEPITAILTEAPGNHAPIGGSKVATENGWFAARPSGTEDVYKIYAESFKGKEHLKQIQEEAQKVINAALK